MQFTDSVSNNQLKFCIKSEIFSTSKHHMQHKGINDYIEYEIEFDELILDDLDLFSGDFEEIELIDM
jgi:hypothetical protein